MCVLFGVLNKSFFQKTCQYLQRSDSVFFLKNFINRIVQLSLFDIPQKEKSKIELEELFEAYFNCRSNKRNTANAIAFEVDYESNLVKLCDEINNGTYTIIL